MNRSLKRAAFLFVPLGILGALIYPFLNRHEKTSATFRTAVVKRGDIQVLISATGTVEPEELVDVGAQVAGKILSFGKDVTGKAVDYGSQVQKGTVLAQIDDALYAADVAQAEAQLAQAKAALTRAEADLVQLQAKLDQALRDWNRARKLGPSEALAQSAYDAALSAHDVAVANVAVGKASIAQSRSAVAQAEATLRKARQNLEYCTIQSPVDGVIIDRRVNIGQTVVASLNAPSLFLIAKDLRRLQIWVAVNEADVGSIRQDQQVLFSADAFPGETFEGRVGKIRLNATLTQNVVTYIVEVNTDNSSGRLLPYLTANARFIVNERPDVLMAPNSALRYVPSPEAVEPGSSSNREDQPGPTPANSGRPKEDKNRIPTLWVAHEGFVKPIKVRTGLNDGAWTEISGEGIEEGLEIVTGEQIQTAESGSATTVNPFTPKIPGRGGSGGARPGGASQR
jgi:HlyD family secretion protein